jgi:hypothetical protein
MTFEEEVRRLGPQSSALVVHELSMAVAHMKTAATLYLGPIGDSQTTAALIPPASEIADIADAWTLIIRTLNSTNAWEGKS